MILQKRFVLCSGCFAAALLFLAAILNAQEAASIPSMPDGAKPAFSEDWASGKIDPAKWYALRKKWGGGNNGVVPENLAIEQDTVDGRERNVLVCRANGDLYDGEVVGQYGNKTRVGGVLVTKEFFASGRFEVVMKIDPPEGVKDGAGDLKVPIGTVPAIWTYAYRYVSAETDDKDGFVDDAPLYNPHMQAYGTSANEYWSELDFPELGKEGDFKQALYNTFCQNRHDPRLFEVPDLADGKYHTFTTEWRTELRPLPGVTDRQVVEHDGFYWVHDKSVPMADYLGNPLKRLGKDRYAVCAGRLVEHWIDGVKVGENDKFVPVMAAQLNIGIWLPNWGGPAPWKTASIRFADVKIWQYGDPGDVRGILTEDIADNIKPPAVHEKQ